MKNKTTVSSNLWTQSGAASHLWSETFVTNRKVLKPGVKQCSDRLSGEHENDKPIQMCPVYHFNLLLVDIWLVLFIYQFFK